MENNSTKELLPPPPTTKKCKYCKEEIAIDAKVCHHCNRHQHWFWQHFRIEQIGLLLTLGLMVLAYFQYRSAAQKEFLANSANEKANVALENIDSLRAVAQVAVNSISFMNDKIIKSQGELSNYNMIALEAYKYDKKAFLKLMEISRDKNSSLRSLAQQDIIRIEYQLYNGDDMILDGSCPYVNLHPGTANTYPKLTYNTALEEYNDISFKCKVSFVSGVLSDYIVLPDPDNTRFLIYILQNEKDIRPIRSAIWSVFNNYNIENKLTSYDTCLAIAYKRLKEFK